MEVSTLTAYHCFAFVWYFFVSYSITLVRAEERPSEVFSYGGQWKYLTVLNLPFFMRFTESYCRLFRVQQRLLFITRLFVALPGLGFGVLGTYLGRTHPRLQVHLAPALFYGVSFLTDVLRLIKKLRCVKCVISSRDLLFSVLAFPVSTFVCVSFWALYTYNRELVYPKSLDGIIPPWLNHAMHTAVLPFALLEIFATPHRYPTKKKGLILLGFTSFVYISWVLWIYSVTGEWVYPLFALFSPAGLAAFFAGSLAIIVCFYSFGEFLNRMIWGDSIVIQDYKRKGK